MSKGYQIVDTALDAMFLLDPTMTVFDRKELAAAVSCTPRAASVLLQQHRKAQARGVTRYVVAARDYGRAGRWYVLAAPGMTPALKAVTGIEYRKLTMGHSEHIAVDAARRVVKDLRTELDPALVNHPVIQAYLHHAAAAMEAQVRLMVTSMHSAVELVERTRKERANRAGVKAV